MPSLSHFTFSCDDTTVRSVWERHMAPAIAANSGHTADFNGFDNADPDLICAFQDYASVQASNEFLRIASYVAYLKDEESSLAGPTETTALTPA
jgi:hypothetical protein